MTNASSWEILKKIVDTYMLEMRIDSINKTIILKEKLVRIREHILQTRST